MNLPNPDFQRSKDEQNMATVMYLSPLATFIIPFGGLIAPLALWLWKRNESARLDTVGKEVLNFSISYSLYGLIAGILCYLLIGFLFMAVLFVVGIFFIIKGALASSKGEFYQFPYIIRLIA